MNHNPFFKMKNYILLITFCLAVLWSCKSEKSDSKQDMATDVSKISASDKNPELKINPISHATMVMNYGDTDIYIDPTGGKAAFETFSTPELVLITDIHGDHFNIETLAALDLEKTTIIAPQAVADKFPEDFKYGELIIMNNGETKTVNNLNIEAIPMYNFGEKAEKYHSKGRGNGYILTLGEDRIYISGDTEDIPEMRNLKDINIAFVCMNLPYTMNVESAVSAVLEFKPEKVYPYHYRGTDGLSDVEKFKTLVNQGDESIEVVQLNWYK